MSGLVSLRRLGLAALAGVVISVSCAFAARRLGGRLAVARADLAGASVDLVDGAWELAAFGATGSALARAEGHAARLARVERRSAMVSSVGVAAGVVVQGLTVVAVILAGLGAGVDEVVIAVLGLTALAAFEGVLPLSDAAQRFVELRPALRRVGEVLDAPMRAREPRLWSAEGLVPDRIVLRDVRVTYDSPALDGIDLRIERGRSVAVVGASGAGKGSLLGVIGGLVEPDGGVVALPHARGLMHDAHVFNTSIRANLLLARALLADPPVLLLDEPTEGLDRSMADAVLRTVLAARAGRTTIVVTHRLACLAEVDEVLVLDRGRAVPPPRDLMRWLRASGWCGYSVDCG